MKDLAVVALAFCVVGATAGIGLHLLPEGERPYAGAGHRELLEAEPWPTVWPSLLDGREVRLPSGAELPYTPPTPTPLPPTPTPEPAYVPPPSVPQQTVETPPVAVGGDWVSVVCSYGWSCAEALNVIAHESGGNPWAVNPSSGACGLFQMLPCVGLGDPWANAAAAWLKYVDGGYSFQRHWYQWWN